MSMKRWLRRWNWGTWPSTNVGYGLKANASDVIARGRNGVKIRRTYVEHNWPAVLSETDFSFGH
jgi:hypothetical protein